MRLLAYILGAALIVVALISVSKRSREGASFERLSPPSGEVSVRNAEALPRLWALPDFSLTERSGEPVTLSTLRGKIWIANFFYTSCPGPCRMLSARMAELQKELSTTDPRLRFVSISTDPATDTPEVMREYATRFHASDRWLFFTGDKTAIYSLVNKGFKLSLTDDPQNPSAPIDHSTKFALVDGTGTIRGVYDGLTEEGKGKLLFDVNRLLHETP